LSRKQLCAKSEAAVEDGVVRAITGRPRRIVAAPPEGAKGDRIVVAA
jgi:hypothetical protein